MVIPLALGALSSLLLSLVVLHLKGVRLIVRIKPELMDVQASKAGTPTVGGYALALGATLASLVCGVQPVWLLGMWLFALVGLWDDLVKTRTWNGDGIRSVTKLCAQFGAAVVIVASLAIEKRIPTNGAYLAFAVFWIVYLVNAVNITDGMDGLAGLVVLFPLVLAVRLEGGTFLACFIGSLVGFLAFNLKPAKYFMGDMGSLALGAVLAVASLTDGHETLFMVATLPLTVELLSSAVQILAIRLFSRKVFLIAPLHHDLQKRGMGEWSVVVLGAVSSLVCTLAGAWLHVKGVV